MLPRLVMTVGERLGIGFGLAQKLLMIVLRRRGVDAASGFINLVRPWLYPSLLAYCEAKVLEARGDLVAALMRYDAAYHHKGGDLSTIVIADYARFLDKNAKYERIVEILSRPQNAVSHNGELSLLLAKAYIKLDYAEMARPLVQSVLASFPLHKEALSIMAHIEDLSLNDQQAEHYARRAFSVDPQNVYALLALSQALRRQKRFHEALHYNVLADQLTTKEEKAEIDAAYFFIYAHLGLYKEAWIHYNRLIGHPVYRPSNSIQNLPLWDGAPLTHGTLCLTTEQGLGDTLQFIRFAMLCKQRAPRIRVVCPKPLLRLIKECPWVDEVTPYADHQDGDVAQIPLMSLPGIFGTTLTTVPHQIPYLFVSDDARKQWAPIFPNTEKPKVGIIWAGTTAKDMKGPNAVALSGRTITLSMLAPILRSGLADFYSLQILLSGKADEAIAAAGLADVLTDVMHNVSDLMDTAALVEQLDLIITIDTSVAHLTGALGKPLWVMTMYNSCWRWADNQPTDNPWYPHARVFGQPSPHDWDSVVANVLGALEVWARSERHHEREIVPER